ncbi:hypothetical protein L195_g051478 [Trifolium pratense]|uniref:Transmembrane protein n=2 Tax=Trifolium pratense TaxID=57577 RepID=A0A2K3JZT1_TRIPR|nr:hypothetical protein L195_g051478 [Trifolium pratense]CAJ2677256.1 unnamed protein product [Trifolium pratense]
MAEFAFAVFIILILAGDSSARDLRPSDHGLVFQSLSPAGTHSSSEMRSFFNGDNSFFPTDSSSSDVAMPKAITSSDSTPPSWRTVSGNGGDRIWNVLKVASWACGIAGGILILVSGLMYVFKYRKQEQNAAFRGNNGEFEKVDEDNDDKKLQLVLRDPSS